MKRLVSAILILVMLMGCAVADVITIDTETASVEEMETAISVLQSAIDEREGRPHEFSNGIRVKVVKAVRNGETVTIYYLFSHQNPFATRFEINDIVSQNGVELKNAYTTADVASYMRTIAGGVTVEVTRTYELIDDSEITVCLRPYFKKDKDYIVVLELE